jgi:hypothetical protein
MYIVDIKSIIDPLMENLLQIFIKYFRDAILTFSFFSLTDPKIFAMAVNLGITE